MHYLSVRTSENHKLPLLPCRGDSDKGEKGLTLMGWEYVHTHKSEFHHASPSLSPSRCFYIFLVSKPETHALNAVCREKMSAIFRWDIITERR